MPPKKIQIDEAFINRVRSKLDGMTGTLATMRTGSIPLFTHLTVKAGAQGYEPGTTLASAVGQAGTNLNGAFETLAKGLQSQVNRLLRLVQISDETESLNTREPSEIQTYLDSRFFTPSQPTPPLKK